MAVVTKEYNCTIRITQVYSYPCITELRVNVKESKIEKQWKTKETTVNKNNKLEIIKVLINGRITHKQTSNHPHQSRFHQSERISKEI